MYIIISTVLDILGIMTTIYKEYILLLSPLSQGRQKCFGGCTSICHGWQISKGNKAKNGRKVPNEAKYFNVAVAIEEGLCRPCIKTCISPPITWLWLRDVCWRTAVQQWMFVAGWRRRCQWTPGPGPTTRGRGSPRRRQRGATTSSTSSWWASQFMENF